MKCYQLNQHQASQADIQYVKMPGGCKTEIDKPVCCLKPALGFSQTRRAISNELFTGYGGKTKLD